MPWAEWLGSTFRVEKVDLTPVQILAECLNEMTWGGWSESQSKEHMCEIMDRIAEIDDVLDKEEDNN